MRKAQREGERMERERLRGEREKKRRRKRESDACAAASDRFIDFSQVKYGFELGLLRQ